MIILQQPCYLWSGEKHSCGSGLGLREHKLYPKSCYTTMLLLFYHADMTLPTSYNKVERDINSPMAVANHRFTFTFVFASLF